MAEDLWAEVRTLEEAAERAGGYVLPPWQAEKNEQGERELAAIRDYALKHSKRVCEMDEADWAELGLAPTQAEALPPLAKAGPNR